MLKIEMDYSTINKNLQNLNYDTPVYICHEEKLYFQIVMAKISEMSMKNFQITKKLNIRKQVIFTVLNWKYTCYVQRQIL